MVLRNDERVLNMTKVANDGQMYWDFDFIDFEEVQYQVTLEMNYLIDYRKNNKLDIGEWLEITNRISTLVDVYSYLTYLKLGESFLRGRFNG